MKQDCAMRYIDIIMKIKSVHELSVAYGVSSISREDGTLRTVAEWKNEADRKMYLNKQEVKQAEGATVMKAKKDVDVNKLNQCQNELQKKELMIEELNTFVVEYNFEMDEST